MSRVKDSDYPSAQHFRAQAEAIRMLTGGITSPALLKRMEEKALEFERKALDLDCADFAKSKSKARL